MKPFLILRKTYAAFLALNLLFSWGTGPLYARRKKEKLSPAEAIEASVNREVKLGDKIAEQIAKNFEFIEDPIVTARVRGIFNKLTPWVQRPLPYNVHIVKEKSPNAFCIPGGNIYVTTGLIDFVNSDSELAFVIAHELCHADGKHGIIQMERNQKLSIGALLIAIASRGQAAALVLSNAVAIMVANAYSRDLEQEADLGAIRVAESAGYDLVAGVTVMEGLAMEELKQPWYDPTVGLDHPRISERIQYIAANVEKRGYKIQRKLALKLLVPSIVEVEQDLVFKIDDSEIARGVASPELQKYFSDAAKTITYRLQMETPSYDIRIDKIDGVKTLCIGVGRFMAAPIPGSSDSIESVRLRVVNALGEARKKLPLTNWNL